MTSPEITGASAVTAENGFGLFLCSAVFFAGTFTVAVTLGFVCDDISSLVATVRNGNYQIVESGHMVILNVNERLRPVLNQAKHIALITVFANVSLFIDSRGIKGTRQFSMSNRHFGPTKQE